MTLNSKTYEHGKEACPMTDVNLKTYHIVLAATIQE